MGFNFPNAPITGQLYPAVVTPGLPQYRYDGEKWRTLVAVAGTASVFVSDTPPAAPVDGMLWWESDTGNLYVRYNDGDSTQWVICGQFPSLTGLVRYDAAQTLTAAQQTQARQNVYAAPFDALAYNGMQINGSTEVSQERGSTSFTAAASTYTYMVDGWRLWYATAPLAINVFPQYATLQPPPGFNYSLLVQAQTGKPTLTSSDQVLVEHPIEGYRVARLAWGTSNAQPISIGFWIYGLIAGTASVVAMNAAANRSYIANFTINNALTWEYKTITIPGDTAGTWNKDNTVGLNLRFCFALGPGAAGIGTAGVWSAANLSGTTANTNFFATTNNYVCLTGLIVLPGIELPSAARAPFIMRPYDQELRLCQRYWNSSYALGQAVGTSGANSYITMFASGAQQLFGNYPFPAPMRAIPTLSIYSFTGTPNVWSNGAGVNQAGAGSFNASGAAALTSGANSVGLTVGQSYLSHYVADARL